MCLPKKGRYFGTKPDRWEGKDALGFALKEFESKAIVGLQAALGVPVFPAFFAKISRTASASSPKNAYLQEEQREHEPTCSCNGARFVPVPPRMPGNAEETTLMEETGRRTVTEITVRSWTLDLYGQVSNAKFLEFLEEARWDHFEGLFESGMFMELGLAFMLVNVNINYRGAARLGDILDIETQIKRLGSKSITLTHIITRRSDHEIILDGDVTFVIKDLEKNEAVPITGRMREMFLREFQ